MADGAAPAAVEGATAHRPSLLWATLAIVALGVLGLDGVLWARFVAAPGYVAQSDFTAWFATARLIATGQGSQIFNVPLHQATQAALIAPYAQANGGLVYHYWPILGGLLLPVAGGSIADALAVWTVAGALAFTGALIVLVRELRFRAADGWLFGLAAWSFLPHIVDLEQGQSSNLLALPLAVGLLALRRGADGPAGLALGLLCLKPQLLPVWVVALLAARRWRALAGLALSALGLAAISTVMAGPGWIGDWIALSRDSVGATSGHGFDAAYSHSFQELIALIPGVGAAGANTAQIGIALGLAALVGWGWWRGGMRNAEARRAPLVGCGSPQGSPCGVRNADRGAKVRDQGPEIGDQLIAATVLAMLLAAPVLNTHDLTFWIIAAAFLLAPAPGAAAQPRPWLPILCWLGWLLPWPAVALLLGSPIKLAAFYMVGLGAVLLLLHPAGGPRRGAHPAALGERR